ncbi:MAG: efflux RND transporter periplasmic adaptor subunit [Rhodobacteraceae bacterium]|nr:efflux RND transporter periplasmic adaptor subunit [Paracoccaceae bacterium]
MRIIPILTAALVAAGLFLLVIERDRLLTFARSDGGGATSDAMAPEAAPAEATPQGTSQQMALADPEQEQSGVPVLVLRSAAREVGSAVVLRGETEANRQVEVRAETSGLVVSDPLRRGAKVQKGQVLCRLGPGIRQARLNEARARLLEARAQVPGIQAGIPESEARLAEARAQLQEARINNNAARKLSEEGFASSARVAATEAAVKTAEAAVKAAEAGLQNAKSRVTGAQAAIESAAAVIASAEEEIERLTIVAPFDGVLEADTAEFGALLEGGANNLCATILQLDPIKLVGFVSEISLGRIQNGAQAAAQLTSGREITGLVTFLARAADPLTHTFRVEILVPNADLSIRDGETVEIQIAAEGSNAHFLAQSALSLDDAGRLGVRVVDDAQLTQFVAVEVIRDTPDGIWVTGLPRRADVIIIGQEYVTDGVPVIPTYREAQK